MSFIETPRLLIRTWMPSDEPALHAMYADGDVTRYLGRGYPDGLPAEAIAPMLRHMIERYERDGIGIWPVVLKDDGRVIGACGLQALPGYDEVEIAYVVAREFWGGGYGFEAASAVMAFGFGAQGLHRIVAVVNKFNSRSIALANRLGMRFERVVRVYRSDLLMYAKERGSPA